MPAFSTSATAGELRGAIDGDEQTELTFYRSYLGQIDVEEADRITIKLLPARLIALDLGQTP